MSTTQIENIIYELAKKGYQLEPKAFTELSELLMLRKDLDFKKVFSEIIEEKKVKDPENIFISYKDFQYLFPKKEELKEEKIVYEDIEADIKVIRDPGNQTKILEGIDGFRKYFLDRYNKMIKIISSRPSQKTILKINQAQEERKNIRIAGLVKDKRIVKENAIIEIEDDTGYLKIISKLDGQNRNAIEILPDQMIIVDISSIKEGIAYASRLEFPEIPDQITYSRAPEVYTLLLSDLHIGSKTFQKEVFEHLLHWLQGLHGEREIIKKIKYVIIAGDLVDGVGVYPHQEAELEILDIKEQYMQVAQYIEQFPKHIEIIIIPGNHDATRQALPQPSIPRKYCEELYKLENVRMFGNPLEIQLHGINFLIYHGRSLDDVLAFSPGIETARPESTMRTLLRARHLAPIFGARTTIAPAEEDSLVIENVPDIFHAGHVHVFGITKYRNTLIVNSGTFQEQTAHQKSIGINPTPGKAAILNHSTMEVFEKDFNQFSINQ
ncbi:MAG: DNA-directed DNA polymerase II small subunit [Nitrososphaeria archaeon]